MTYAAATGALGISIDLTNVVPATGPAVGDTFFGIENVIGTKNADTIQGNGRANTLTGGTGDDQIEGASGSDRLLGGDGSDLLGPGADSAVDLVNGGDGVDSVTYFFSPTGVIVDMEAGTTGGDAVNDVLISIENVFGSTLAADSIKVVRGGFASGYAGDDVLSGSSSAVSGPFPTAEYLQGGAGADSFVLHYGWGADYIIDFSFLEGDKLRVSDAEFGTSSASNIVNWSGQVVPTVADKQFIFDTSTSHLYFDSDGTGSAAGPVLVAVLLGTGAPLVASDFVFVA